MHNFVEELNSSISFSIYVSPFVPTVISHGIHRWNHTTTAGLVYRRSTLPTPWPYLAGGLGLSLLTTLWTFISSTESYDVSRGESSLKKTIGAKISYTSFGVSTIRSWALFIHSINAMINHSNYKSSVMVFTLFVSLLPEVFRSESALGIIMGINVVIVYASFLMMVFTRLGRGAADFYGGLYLASGNCPSVSTCKADSRLEPGCRRNLTGDPIFDGGKKRVNEDFGPNMIGSAEYVLGMLYALSQLIIMPLVWLGTIVLLIYIPIVIVKGIKRIRKAIQQRRIRQELSSETGSRPGRWEEKELTGWLAKAQSWFVRSKEDDDDTMRARRVYAAFAILIICLSAAIVIPVTYAQQTRGKTFRIQDSFGPWIQTATLNGSLFGNNSYEADGSWSDCFDVPTVVDR